MTRQILLTRDAVTQVSDEDYERLLDVGSWVVTAEGYAVHWYSQEDGKRRALYMHRYILSAPPYLHVDHINHDRLDNRRENLRFATRSQNNANRNRHCNNTSLYKGVSWHEGGWEVRIGYQEERIYLGRYQMAMQAAWVYDAAARKLFGEFALENLPGLPGGLLPEYYAQYWLEQHGLLKD